MNEGENQEMQVILQEISELHMKLDKIGQNMSTHYASVETNFSGLSTDLNNLQERLSQLELKINEDVNSEISSPSISSTDEETGQAIPETESISRSDERPKQICKHKDGGNNCQRWLQENHLVLVMGLDPSRGLLLDYLFQDRVISDSDKEHITSHVTRKDRTRELLFIMRHVDNEKVTQFVQHLKKDFPHLVSNFSTDSETGELSCLACDVVNQVKVNDVIDVLYQEFIIDDDLYEQIWRCSTKKKGWNKFIKSMNSSRMPKCLKILAKALESKYPKICKRMDEMKISTLSCCCRKQKVQSTKRNRRNHSKIDKKNPRPAKTDKPGHSK